MSEPFSIVIQCNTDVNRKNFYKAFQHLRPTSFSSRAETTPRREVSQSVSQSEGGGGGGGSAFKESPAFTRSCFPLSISTVLE